MSAMTHDLLVRGIAAAKADEKPEAIRYFTRLLGLDPTVEEQTETWQWLATLVEDPIEKKAYLDEILSRNPGDARARRKLAELSGAINPADVIDPDRKPAATPIEPVRAKAQRFVCTACGARMVFTADGNELVCENCGSRRAIGGLKSRLSAVKPANFAAAMATTRGHEIPVRARITACQGCGAEFRVPAHILSENCPYCGSSYATSDSSEKETIQPASLIPFKFREGEIRERLQSWFAAEGFDKTPWYAAPRGFYIPIWDFTVDGQLSWVASIQNNDRWETIRDAKIIHHPEILVPATNRLPEAMRAVVNTFQLAGMVNFDPHYLADWMAETYQIPVGDASLNARKAVLEVEKEQIPNQYNERITNLRIDPASMAVDSYQLILLPIWLTTYQHDQERFEVTVNGQNGQVIGQLPARGLSEWISGIFGG